MTYRAAIEEPGGLRCLVLEDDDHTAWAWLIVDGAVVCGVWLYDVAEEARLDAAASRATPQVVPRLSRNSHVEVEWGIGSAILRIDGVETSHLDDGPVDCAIAQLSSEELGRRAHVHYHTEGPAADERYWSVIRELHRRGTRAEFELAQSLIARGETDSSATGCDMLAQLGTTARWPEGAWPFREESLPLLLSLLEHQELDVRAKAVSALGHLGLDGFEERIIALAGDASKYVRVQVAFALGGRDDDASLRALAHLSGDVDSDVRDWATLGIGSQTDRDEPWIRDALYARVADPFIDVAVEGMLGLARCADPRGLPMLKAWLEAGAEYTGMLDAAADYAEPTLLPLLEQLRANVTDESSEWVSSLERAITKCSPP